VRTVGVGRCDQRGRVGCWVRAFAGMRSRICGFVAVAEDARRSPGFSALPDHALCRVVELTAI
jgi:hypothetical protein